MTRTYRTAASQQIERATIGRDREPVHVIGWLPPRLNRLYLAVGPVPYGEHASLLMRGDTRHELPPSPYDLETDYGKIIFGLSPNSGAPEGTPPLHPRVLLAIGTLLHSIRARDVNVTTGVETVWEDDQMVTRSVGIVSCEPYDKTFSVGDRFVHLPAGSTATAAGRVVTSLVSECGPSGPSSVVVEPFGAQLPRPAR